MNHLSFSLGEVLIGGGVIGLVFYYWGIYVGGIQMKRVIGEKLGDAQMAGFRKKKSLKVIK